jgi:hypothetical protein
MVNNVYLFGAGVSQGTVPLVSETCDALKAMLVEMRWVRTVLVGKENNVYHTSLINRFDRIFEFVVELDSVLSNANYPLTPDEWAKRLYHSESPKFHELRKVLSLFYTWHQRTAPICPRLEHWAHELIDGDAGQFPAHSLVLSWNYDWQLEAVCGKALDAKSGLDPNPPRCQFLRKWDKSITQKQLCDNPTFKVFKLNGDAFWLHPAMAGFSEKIIGTATPETSVIEFWKKTISEIVDLEGKREGEVSCALSYAFHDASQTEDFFGAIENCIGNATNLTVAGYSFPQANQQWDAKIFAAMKQLKTIIVYNLPSQRESLLDSISYLLVNVGRSSPVIQFINAGKGLYDRIPVMRFPHQSQSI